MKRTLNIIGSTLIFAFACSSEGGTSTADLLGLDRPKEGASCSESDIDNRKCGFDEKYLFCAEASRTWVVDSRCNCKNDDVICQAEAIPGFVGLDSLKRPEGGVSIRNIV